METMKKTIERTNDTSVSMANGYIAHNNIVHKIRIVRYNINGQDMVSMIPVCGTSYKRGQERLIKNESHINCEKCLKRLSKQGA